MRLLPGQRVISLLTSRDETLAVLTATEFGYGKRTPIAEYTRHGRGTQGMIAIQSSERNGSLVAALLVGNEDGIMLITTGGVLIRTRVSEIRELGRSTQGVRLINLGDNEKLAGLEKVLEPDEVEDAAAGVSIVGAEDLPSAGDDSSPAADESSPE
jgi:DNA gyrase subunit A